MTYRITLHKGEVFSRLTVIEGDLEHPYNGRTMAKCRCECGEICTTFVYSIRSGRVKSCGCLKREKAKKQAEKIRPHPRKNLTGETFGFWRVLQTNGFRNGNKVYLCECFCGFKKNLESPYLVRGKTKSCGCKSRAIGKGRKKTEMPVGRRFGSLVVTSTETEVKGGRHLYQCKCDCGEVVSVDGAALRRGQKSHKECRIKRK